MNLDAKNNTNNFFDEIKEVGQQVKKRLFWHLDLMKSSPIGTLLGEIPEDVGYALRYASARILKGKKGVEELNKYIDLHYQTSWKNWLIGISAISVGTLPVTAPVAYKAGQALNNMANEANRPEVYVLTQSEQEILNTQFEQLKHDPQLRKALMQRLQQDDLQRIRSR